jgi:hypothetical protein
MTDPSPHVGSADASRRSEEKLIVKWKWWYPAGCIDTDDLEVSEFTGNYPPFDGEEAASIIIDRYVDECGADGANNFEIEIKEPAEWAGVYDVELEWTPSAYAKRRKKLDEPRGLSAGEPPGGAAANPNKASE